MPAAVRALLQGLRDGDRVVDVALVVVGDHVRHRPRRLHVREPGPPFARVALRGERERRAHDLRTGGDTPDLPVGGVPHLEVLGAVDTPGPEDGDVRLVPDVVGELQSRRLQRSHRGVDEADPVGAVAVVARVPRVRRLAAVRTVDVADQYLVLRVVGRLGEPFRLRDDRVEVGPRGRAVLVAVLDPAAGEPSAAAERVDPQRLEELVGGLAAVLVDAVEESLPHAGRRSPGRRQVDAQRRARGGPARGCRQQRQHECQDDTAHQCQTAGSRSRPHQILLRSGAVPHRVSSASISGWTGRCRSTAVRGFRWRWRHPRRPGTARTGCW